MTFFEVGVEELKNRGMFDNQANEVMKKVVLDSNSNPESVNKQIKNRWNDDMGNYPPPMRVIFIYGN